MLKSNFLTQTITIPTTLEKPILLNVIKRLFILDHDTWSQSPMEN